MATDMHQAAFPGEDISDRPAPETVVPALLALLDGDLPSGRYRAADLVAGGSGPMTTTFALPADAEATAPPEWQGLERDEVRLMAVRPGRLTSARFRDLPGLLEPGDLVVVNTSATLPGRLDARRADGVVVPLHCVDHAGRRGLGGRGPPARATPDPTSASSPARCSSCPAASA